MANKERNSYDEIYTWNVKDLYETEEDYLNELDSLSKDIKKIGKYKGKLLESSKNLLEFLKLDNSLSKRLEQAYIYGHINNDADTRDTHYQDLYGRVVNINHEYCELSSFVVPELLESDESVVCKYIKECTELKEYERGLREIYRAKDHILSKEQEELIASFGKIFSLPEDIESSLTDADFYFDDIIVDGKHLPLNESNFSLYLADNNREVRRQAFMNIYKTYKEHKNTLATTLKGEVEINNLNAKLRGYKDSLNASLFHNHINEEVYYNLIDSVHKNLPSLYNYFHFKKDYLGLDELHIYDTYVDLEKNDKKISFESARDMVINALTPLGDNYIKDLKKSFSDGWIDSINNEGKRGGAYCTACYNVHPYVLLSYENDLHSTSTLAHELGHAMHYYYACKNQSYQDYGYSIFVAEVASQVNEILLSQYLLDNESDPKMKIKLIDDLLQRYKSTIFRQTMFAEFELFIHKYAESGNILTNDVMNDKYFELNKLYFGDEVCVDEEIKYEWERIPHFYYNFYVYQYATGFAAAIKIANEIYHGNNKVKDKYLEFLTLGCSKPPLESLKLVGIDMAKADVMNDAIHYMDELLEEINKLKAVI